MANVLIEESTLSAIGKAIRAKTGKTDLILPSAMATEIAEITGGGGESSDLVKYVTFMSWNGEEILYKKPTISGDDCVNVVSKGLISKPTRESTNTTNYTYSGWSLTSGGSADSSALKNVTEDRVVYASFTESVRYYTVNFYIETGVLHETVQVTYGGTATPSKTPEKKGYGFNGWTPSNENITANTDCYAIWSESISFANASWADIAEIAESGKASTTFGIGDTRKIPYGDSEIEVMVVGFGHDDLSSGTGKAGITIISKEPIPDTFQWSSTGSSTMRYNKSTLNSGLTNTVLPKLPTELQNVIKTVNKDYVYAPDKPSSGGVSASNAEFKLWIPSATEIGYGGNMPTDYTVLIGTVYDAFESTALVPINNTGTSMLLWLRDQAIQSNGNYNVASKNAALSVTTKQTASLYHDGGLTNRRKSIIGFCI